MYCFVYEANLPGPSRSLQLTQYYHFNLTYQVFLWALCSSYAVSVSEWQRLANTRYRNILEKLMERVRAGHRPINQIDTWKIISSGSDLKWQSDLKLMIPMCWRYVLLDFKMLFNVFGIQLHYIWCETSKVLPAFFKNKEIISQDQDNSFLSANINTDVYSNLDKKKVYTALVTTHGKVGISFADRNMRQNCMTLFPADPAMKPKSFSTLFQVQYLELSSFLKLL